MPLTFLVWRHWKELKNLILFLTVAWTIVILNEIIHDLIWIIRDSEDESLKVFWFYVTRLCQALTFLTLFRLKALEIYMLPTNDTVEKISKQLCTLNCLRIFYFIPFTVLSVLVVLGGFGLEINATNSGGIGIATSVV